MDASLLRYDEFRSFLVEAVSRVARKQYPESKSLDAVVRYVESEVKEPSIAEFLINKNVYAYVERYGLDSADAYCAVFDRYVKSPLLVKNFETLCNRWRKLSVGALSPNFNCTDLSGKKVSLSDFKEKYVYIDIWATWCGPCQREIPHLQKLEEKGIKIANVTLHVGIGTFRPVKEENIEEHKMHTEHYYIKPEDAQKINETKKAGKRVISVGTTSCRVLETIADEKTGMVAPTEGDTQIFIYPGYKFKCLDALITNFHLPKSTLLMLVSALAGKDYILKAYNEAVEQKYRFFSFGDAMFIK